MGAGCHGGGACKDGLAVASCVLCKGVAHVLPQQAAAVKVVQLQLIEQRAWLAADH
jgi:hypothetical protein